MRITPILCLFALLAGCSDHATSPDPAGVDPTPSGKLVVSAGLSPNPSAVDLSEIGSWNRTPFQVQLSHPVFDQIKVVANPSGFERLVEITHVRPGANARSYCPPEGNDSRIRRPHQSVWLEACGSGTATVVLTTIENVPIDTLTFEVGTPPEPEDTTFDIELVFIDGGALSSLVRGRMRLAVEVWETVITGDLRDWKYVGNGFERDTFIGRIRIPPNDTVDDLRVYVGVFNAPDEQVWGRAQNFGNRPRGNTAGDWLPVYSGIGFNLARFADIDQAEAWFSLSLHELGHALGFLAPFNHPDAPDQKWIRSPSCDDQGADAHFAGPGALVAFTRVGGNRYAGAKVPLENDPEAKRGKCDSHWRESVFRNELMSTYLGGNNGLSVVTVGAMEDLGYQVDYSAADRYWLPAPAKPAATVGAPFCRVLPPIEILGPKELNEF